MSTDNKNYEEQRRVVDYFMKNKDMYSRDIEIARSLVSAGEPKEKVMGYLTRRFNFVRSSSEVLNGFLRIISAEVERAHLQPIVESVSAMAIAEISKDNVFTLTVFILIPFIINNKKSGLSILSFIT